MLHLKVWHEPRRSRAEADGGTVVHTGLFWAWLEPRPNGPTKGAWCVELRLKPQLKAYEEIKSELHARTRVETLQTHRLVRGVAGATPLGGFVCGAAAQAAAQNNLGLVEVRDCHPLF